MPRAHWYDLAIVLLIAGAIYAPVSQAYFVGFDDFYVVHRTAFEDVPHPVGMITTTHFSSAKYRPGARVLDYLTYKLGSGQPIWFRIRNIACHMGAGVLVYILGIYLLRSWAIAFSAALLFVLHPLANQSTVAASWTITPAAVLLLASLVLLIRAARSARWVRWLTASLFCLGASLFIYEAGIVMVGLWAVFVILERPPRPFVVALAVGLGLVLGMFFVARALVVHYEPEHGTVSTIAKNLVFFSGALLTAPADSILAHDLFGAPLPSQISFRDRSFLLPVCAGLTTIAFVAVLLQRRRRSSQAFPEPFPWQWLLGIAASIPLWLVPFLLFTPHPSETYLYLPTVSASLLMATFLHSTLRSRAAFTVIGFLALLFGVATYNRSRHVIAGAEIARRVVSEFPLEHWQRGTWDIRVAEADPALPRYGIYSYRGLATIDVGDPGIPATQYALQLATANPNLAVHVVSAKDMRVGMCPDPIVCYWVYADGHVARTMGDPPDPTLHARP